MLSYEFSLVFFTVFGQTAAGLVLLIWLTGLRRWPKAERRAWLVALAFGIVAIISSATHLHSLAPAPYSITGVGSSWLSREILAGGIFGILVLLRVLKVFKAGFNPILGILSICFTLVMTQIYFQNSIVPLWNTWGAFVVFLATMPLLGGAGIAALSPEIKEIRPLKTVFGAFLLGAVFSLAMPIFWLQGVLSPLDPFLLQTFTTAAICMGLTQMAGYVIGGFLLICGVPNKRPLAVLGWVVVIAGAVVGRMLFYAANLKVGF